MPGIGHQRDTRVSLIWGNVEAPVSNGSPATKDWDGAATTTLTSLELPVEGFTFFELNQNNRRVNRQTGARFRTKGDTWNDTKGTTPGVTLSMPATSDLLDLFLYMTFQRVAEGASTPFVKDFSYPDVTAVSHAAGRYPDFEGNEGGFCGLVFSSLSTPFSSYEEMLMGCIPTQLRISGNSDQHDGQLWLEADMIARFASTGNTYTGTITAASNEPATRFHINDIGVRTLVGTASTPIYGFGFTIDTGLQFVPYPGSGGGGSTSAVMNGPNASGYVDFLVDDTGTTPYSLLRAMLKEQAILNGSYAATVLAWGDGTTSTDGELTFTTNFQPTALVPVGSNEMRFRCDFDCQDTGTGDDPNFDALTVSYANAKERGW